MQIGLFTPVNKLDIWMPRYKDRVVLLAKHKIGTHNEVTFTKAPHMGKAPYYISGEKAKQFPIESNGKISCYAVPVSELEPLERV